VTLGFNWDADLDPAARDALIDSIVKHVNRFGMHVPAVLALESMKPLSYLAGQALILGSGFLAPIFGPQHVQRFSKLLQSRDDVERLIKRIEESAGKPPALPAPHQGAGPGT
jgi:hypothetical protein